MKICEPVITVGAICQHCFIQVGNVFKEKKPHYIEKGDLPLLYVLDHVSTLVPTEIPLNEIIMARGLTGLIALKSKGHYFEIQWNRYI